MFKISPDETLQCVQELYEKKLVTYPRTDARVLSTAVSKEIYKNINGLKGLPWAEGYVDQVLEMGSYKKISATRYVNDKQITDHYAIIPTGQGIGALRSVSERGEKGIQYHCAAVFKYILSPGCLPENQPGDSDAGGEILQQF